MSGYTDIKQGRMRNLFRKLQNQSDIEISNCGKYTKIKCIHTGESYPIPCSHNLLNKHIVHGFMSWLAQNKVCTKKEFDEML